MELGWGNEEVREWVREAMEGYNSEDCLSAAKLREWLEAERKTLEKGGVNVPRPPEKSGDPSDRLQKKLDAAAELKERLSRGILAHPNARSKEQSGPWLLPQLVRRPPPG